MVVSYKECLKNHAASLGGHALDGCGEFMPSPTATSDDPTSLKCAACGCHRNFHRRDPYEPTASNTHFLAPPPAAAATFQRSSSPSTDPSTAPSLETNSPQQQPVTSPAPCSYFSSAPHMLLALSTGYTGPSDDHHYPHPHRTGFNQVVGTKSENPCARKRSRTRFTQEQKEKMQSFAEKLGWKMNRAEEKLTQEFCSEVGVSRRVFKVWMHNNKNAFGKKESGNTTAPDIDNHNDSTVNGSSRVGFDINGFTNNGKNQNEESVLLSPKSEE